MGEPMRRWALLFLVATGCGHPRGTVDAETGLQGIAVSEGSLAGDWVTFAAFETIVPAGILGEQPGGFRSHLLLHRAWKDRRYADTWVRCGREELPVAGTHMAVPRGTFARLLPVPGSATADHPAGTVLTDDVIELWGVRDLPEPATTPLPTPSNFRQSPQAEQIFDEDQDGELAVTEVSLGAVGGRVFVVERIVFALQGTVVTPDRVQGLARLRSNSANRLVSTSPLLEGASETRQDPERPSWFDQVRLHDGAGCAEVEAAIATGTVSTSRPFLE